MWSAVDVGILVVNHPQDFEVTLKKKQPLAPAGRPRGPQDWEGLRKDKGVNVL